MLNVLFEGASPLQATVLEALDCSKGQEGQVTVAAQRQLQEGGSALLRRKADTQMG